jgi:hypothetical protein
MPRKPVPTIITGQSPHKDGDERGGYLRDDGVAVAAQSSHSAICGIRVFGSLPIRLCMACQNE